MQDLIIFVVPKILGSGIPLYDHIGRKIRLIILCVEKYENRLVRIGYEVRRGEF